MIRRKFTIFSLLNVKTSSDRLLSYFKNAEELYLTHLASAENHHYSNSDIISYLNPIHPYLIHLIGESESDFLKNLSDIELNKLIDQLSTHNAQYLIFENQNAIPACFFKQNKIHLIISNSPLKNLKPQLTHEVNQSIAERVSQHGTFVVVFNKGILITGDSGTGKSSLLLSLIKQGHLWVSDDLSLFFLNNNNQVIGHASDKLSGFIHIKGIGPVNMDKNYGQACRIQSHPLAAVIHLSNNSINENNKISAYTQLDTLTLLNKNFPMWHLPTTHSDLTTMVENCAKNLILNDWNYNAINGLENALNNALATSKSVTSRQV